MNNVVTLGGEEFEAPSQDCVQFVNPGEIDMLAVSTMGLSVKSEGAIGYFGTGLKYAIAVLLREGMDIQIWSGKKHYTFEMKEQSFRDRKFNFIFMNGKSLGYTTEFGKNWELWQAFRELYCNCTDEGGTIGLGEATGQKGKTTITVTGGDFAQIFAERGQYILQTSPLLRLDGMEVHPGVADAIFYKGVRVHTNRNSLYTYNLTCPCELTEDRTLKYYWIERGKIMNAIATCDHADFIKEVCLAPPGSFESQLNFMDSSECTATPSETFLDVVGQLPVDKANKSALHFCQKHRQATGMVEAEELTEAQEKMFIEAQELAKQVGWENAYPIIWTEQLGFNILGMAKNNTIFLNTRLFQQGVPKLAHALLEEFWHLKYGFSDESREFQNFLFEKIIERAMIKA